MRVAVLGYTSRPEEWVNESPVKVPKRDSACTMAQRSAAQYGQYSAPM